MGKKLILLVGNSGSGKTSISDCLKEKYKLDIVKSYTTRNRRFDGEDTYRFITKNEFLGLEHIRAWTLYHKNFYGVTEEILKGRDLYVIDPYGIKTLKENYTDKDNLISVGIWCPLNKRVKNMRSRGDSFFYIIKKVSGDIKSFYRFKRNVDFIIYNDGKVTVENLADNIMNLTGGKHE